MSSGHANNSTQAVKLYWIDQSCHEAARGNFEEYILEARHWARRAFERLNSATDTDFARIFNLIVKTPKTDTERSSTSRFWQQINGIQPEHHWQTQHVRGVLYDFAHRWRRTDNRARAHVRIYSSARGLNRWTATRSGKIVDPINHVFLTGDWDDLTSREAFVSFLLPNPASTPSNENPHRVTLDISPSAWQTSAPLSLSSINTTQLLSSTTTHHGVSVAQLCGPLMARLVFHEFMHARAYLLDDHARDGGPTSGWAYCMRRKKGEAATCAESIAMLGLWWAALADLRPAGYARGGFSVYRGWDHIPGGWDDFDSGGFEDDEEVLEEVTTRKWDVNWGGGNEAVRGVLRFYRDITN